jgi:hypothetical protein
VLVLWDGEVYSWNMKKGKGGLTGVAYTRRKGVIEIWEGYYPSAVIFLCSSL